MMTFQPELLDRLLKGYKKPEDLLGEGGILKQLTQALVERCLEAEMKPHLDEHRTQPERSKPNNRRNGHRKKTIKGEFGKAEIAIPRDRAGEFEPIIIQKRQARFDRFDDKILSLYARGMSTRDITAQLQVWSNSSLPHSEIPATSSLPFPSRYGLEEVATHERVAIFIDGSNLFYAASQLSLEIDYAKFLHFLVGGRKLLRAYFYSGIDRTNEKQQGFLLWMSRNGYRVISKDLQQMPDGSKKANLDVEMAVDMISLIGSYDTAVLVTGDADLAYAANAIAYYGVWVEVVSLPSMPSDSLLNLADCHTDLSAIQAEICREHK